MSVFAFTGMRVVARLGYGRLIQTCLLALAIASLLRALMPQRRPAGARGRSA